ncbi:MAG: SDR family oxidoreductase [bacterium]
MKVKNKVALVTGGARRLGRDISISLSQLGYDIVLNYNESKKSDLEYTIAEIIKNGVNVNAIRCNVSNVSEVRKMFHAVYTKYKRLDVLINNAAIFRHTDFLETTEKIFDEFVGINLKGTFFCSQEAAKIMLKGIEGNSRIINIASLGATENWTGYIPYSLSKAGIVKLSQQLAKRLAPKILVNAISPGTILIEKDENATVNFEEEKKYPMGRFARSEDITSLITFLVQTNNYITGHNFNVDGGRSL